MLEITTTRHNPLIDPQLAVWSWEIPVYLFFGGLVAGMMVLAGVAMWGITRALSFQVGLPANLGQLPTISYPGSRFLATAG